MSADEVLDRHSAAPLLNLAVPDDSGEEMLSLDQLMKNRRPKAAAKGTGT